MMELWRWVILPLGAVPCNQCILDHHSDTCQISNGHDSSLAAHSTLTLVLWVQRQPCC